MYSLSIVSLKLSVGFSIFRFRFVFIKVNIFFNKKDGLFDFKTSLFLLKLNRKATHSFVPRPLIFKLDKKF